MLCSHDLRRMLIAFAHSIKFAFRASFMREFVTNLKEGAVNASLGPWSQLSIYMCIGSGLESLRFAAHLVVFSDRSFTCVISTEYKSALVCVTHTQWITPDSYRDRNRQSQIC